MKPLRRPGFLGDQVYWFDTPEDEVTLEKAARRGHTSSGSARSGILRYIPRIFQKRSYKFDWQKMPYHRSDDN